jgi:4-amino-4-deoxy-L-arabinose transferase-like glycosyltransferase
MLSIPTTFFIWRAGALLIGESEDGARAALFFNLTLMATTQFLLATPDAPVMACSAAFLWALAELATTRNPQWWIVAGLFAGLGLLSKYTMVCLGGGAALWLVLTIDGRRWLRTPWPWLGGIVAVVVFAPNLIWNLEHGMGTLAFQFGRLTDISPSWQHLPQFLLERLMLASPCIMILAGYGLWRATTRYKDDRQFLIAALIWPSLVFFGIYALQNRVHRNWVDFLYPALAIAAAAAFRRGEGPRLVRATATPVAVLLIATAYGLALTFILTSYRIDPLSQRFATNMHEVVEPITDALTRTGAHGIASLNVATTAWLRFYMPPGTRVIQLDADHRLQNAPRATAADLAGTLLYVQIASVRNAVPRLPALFSEVVPLEGTPAHCERGMDTPFCFYRLGGFRGSPIGRVP